MGARWLEAPIEDPLPAMAPRFRGVAHLAAFVAAVPAELRWSSTPVMASPSSAHWFSPRVCR